jgi:hypothetical protein
MLTTSILNLPSDVVEKITYVLFSKVKCVEILKIASRRE